MCAGHPNIVQLREVFLTETQLAVVVEYANGGDLAHYTDALMRHTVGPRVLTLLCMEVLTAVGRKRDGSRRSRASRRRQQGRGIQEAQARVLFQQLMVAVDYCHSLGIANRDIKVGSSDVWVSTCVQAA